MSAEPEVSVVIPTRDRVGFLSGALRCALGQEDVAVEVVVVDDGSGDGTPSLLASLDDPRLRVIRFDRSRGQMEARNAGVAAARAPWIAFLDDDDLWAPDKLRRQLDEARRTGASWVFCGVLLISPEGDVVPVPAEGDPAGILKELLQRNVVQAGASTVLVDAARLRALGGFQDGLNNPWDLWIRLAADGSAAAVEEPLAAYRRHSSSFVTASRETVMADARRIVERHRGLAEKHGVEFDLDRLDRWLDSELVRGLRSAASTRLREGRRLEAARLQLRALATSRSRSDLRRLLRIVLGERARRLVNGVRPAPRDEPAREPVPAWLAPYL